VLVGLAGCGPRAEPDPFTIGQLVPLSGSDKSSGEHAKNGAAIAIEVALREDQRVLGRKVAVRHVDYRSDAELVQPEAVRLLTFNRVIALLGGPDAPGNEQLARAARTYGVPVLLPADLAALPSGEAVFGLNATPEARGEALARSAVRNLKWQRVVALTDNSEGVEGALAGAFIRKWRQERRDDKEAFAELCLSHKDADWAELLQQTRAAKPDGVLLAVGPEKFLRLRNEIVKSGLKVPLLYGGEDRGSNSVAELPKDGPAVYLATAFTSGGNLGSVGEAFVRQYADEFHEPPDLAAAMAYDAVRMSIEAAGRAKSTLPAALGSELLALANFQSVTGPLSLTNRRARRRLFVVSLQGGGSKVVGTFDPDAE
jgi:branched-chain amino acid transport system substrate-binding protein